MEESAVLYIIDTLCVRVIQDTEVETCNFKCFRGLKSSHIIQFTWLQLIRRLATMASKPISKTRMLHARLGDLDQERDSFLTKCVQIDQEALFWTSSRFVLLLLNSRKQQWTWPSHCLWRQWRGGQDRSHELNTSLSSFAYQDSTTTSAYCPAPTTWALFLSWKVHGYILT